MPPAQPAWLGPGTRVQVLKLTQQTPYPLDFFANAPVKMSTLHMLLLNCQRGLHDSGLCLCFLYTESTIVPTQTPATKAYTQWAYKVNKAKGPRLPP